MTSKNEEQCALCQKIRTLKNSHIIPEFLFAPLYDEKHKFHTFGHDGEPATSSEQNGLRELLLCHDCEQRFSVYEGWASEFYKGAIAAFADTTRPELIRGRGLKFTRIDQDGKPTTAAVPRMLNVEGFDYEKMKLFLLSLLWRMGVSKLHYFGKITLGHQEKRIRKMLLDSDPGAANQYACQLRLIELGGKLITDYQSQPRQFDQFGRKCCVLYTTGVRFDFMVSNHAADQESVELFCVKPQSQYVCWIDSITTHPDLSAELTKFGAQIGAIEDPTISRSGSL